jgi:hypothetical protein
MHASRWQPSAKLFLFFPIFKLVCHIYTLSVVGIEAFNPTRSNAVYLHGDLGIQAVYR